ncbi:MAG: glutamate--tRNA ligase [Nocardioidaceae bacterium]
MSGVRVRFCPSPTGNLHVGNVRTALFNWAYARHTGGTFVFRVEDTDAARDSEDSYAGLLESLRWLGLDWDEGPEVGGEHGPYRQSERSAVYTGAVAQLLDSGRAYLCYSTTEEVEQRRRAAGIEGGPTGYDNYCRDLTREQVDAYVAQGRKPVVRFRMPDEPIVFDDLVRGEIRFEAEHVPDYVVVRANGQPLYTLTNPVDDATMGITHVLRGEDLLSSTPRQIPLHHALVELGLSAGEVPRYGHLPFVLGPGNKKLSKRDPGGGLLTYRERGFLPEGLLNYLALLGWSIGGDREFFGLAEMGEVFDVTRVNPNPAQFDLKKAEAVNGQHVRSLDPADLARRLVPYLQTRGALGAEPIEAELALLTQAAPLVQERMTVLAEGAGMLRFLFAGDADFRIDDADRTTTLDAVGLDVVRAAHASLAGLPTWDTPSIEAALRTRLIEQLGLKPRHAFGPVRVAVTGARVSPPLFESLELLGRERSLARLEAALRG